METLTEETLPSAYVLPGIRCNTFENFVSVVSAAYNITPSKLYEKTNKREIVEPRQLVIFYLLNVLKYTQVKAGQPFLLDHATSLHAKRNIQGMIKTNTIFRLKFIEISHELGLKGHEINNLIEGRKFDENSF